MANVAFDLDETIGRFVTPFYHLIFLDPTMFYEGQGRGRQPFLPSENLKKKLDSALTNFAHCLASDDVGKQLLRPGILKIVKKISDAKDNGQIKNVVVYSNNGNLNCLKLATRMIEFLLGKSGIFCDHIHFYNPIRQLGDNPDMRNPGTALKTWRVFQQLFSQKCGDNTPVQAETSYFFDDIIHPHIYAVISASNYFNVNSYKKDTPFDPINRCFNAALQSQGLDTNNEYFRYINPIIGNPSNLLGIYFYLSGANRGYNLKNEPFSDDTEEILDRLEKIFPTPVSSTSISPNVNTSRININTRTIPFNVGTSINTSSSVPFFGGKPRRKHKHRHSSRKQKKYRKGTRKN